MNQQDLLTSLKEHYPHLYDIEMEVRRIQASTGYGDVSVVIKVNHGKVDSQEFLGSARKLYRVRVANKF